MKKRQSMIQTHSLGQQQQQNSRRTVLLDRLSVDDQQHSLGGKSLKLKYSVDAVEEIKAIGGEKRFSRALTFWKQVEAEPKEQEVFDPLNRLGNKPNNSTTSRFSAFFKKKTTPTVNTSAEAMPSDIEEVKAVAEPEPAKEPELEEPVKEITSSKKKRNSFPIVMENAVAELEEAKGDVNNSDAISSDITESVSLSAAKDTDHVQAHVNKPRTHRREKSDSAIAEFDAESLALLKQRDINSVVVELSGSTRPRVASNAVNELHSSNSETQESVDKNKRLTGRASNLYSKARASISAFSSKNILNSNASSALPGSPDPKLAAFSRTERSFFGKEASTPPSRPSVLSPIKKVSRAQAPKIERVLTKRDVNGVVFFELKRKDEEKNADSVTSVYDFNDLKGISDELKGSFPVSPINGQILSNQERAIKRNQVRAEILDTEKSYINYLEILVNEYSIAMMCRCSELGFTINEVQSIFTNVEMIYRFHIVLIEQLKENSNVAQVFLKNADFLKMYTLFCNGYEKSIEILARQGKNKKFQQFLADKRSSAACKGMDIMSLLIMPVQRVPRYELLIRQLIKYTLTEDPEQGELMQSLNKIQSVVDHMNEMKRKTEQMSRLIEINNRLHGAEKMSFEVISPERLILSKIFK
jgi:hypothetical protein